MTFSFDNLPRKLILLLEICINFSLSGPSPIIDNLVFFKLSLLNIFITEEIFFILSLKSEIIKKLKGVSLIFLNFCFSIIFPTILKFP